ncbi:hypothetical protein ACQP1O_43210 (plasmid) [Nocardia sp. CA-151230]|uniref:hypothetical protein n=1 Tax=Nocardia sp. CA-151230 TaxID=3239982 RepID=UPI003D8E8314
MGTFAQFSDVQAEFEGVIPSTRQAWTEAKIDAVEARLIGLVPSLSSLTSVSDPARFSRVKHLVVEKVLRLFRNPSGVTQQTAGPFSTAYSSTTASGAISFTDEELSTIRQRTKRANLGVATVAPWRADQAPGVFPVW